MPIRKNKQTEGGFALLLAITVASVLLALGLTMLTVTTKQLTLSSISRESEIAFQAAMAGLECISFHRRALEVDYVDPNPTAPAIRCFDVNDDGTRQEDHVAININDGYVNVFNYRFDWETSPGVNERCTETDLYMMVNTKTAPPCNPAVPGSCDITFDFDAYNVDAVGNNGVKTCRINGVCTVAVSRGYNKSCEDVDKGLATVQRELTSEF